MAATELQRTMDFRMSFARRQAAVVREVPCGAVVLDPAYPASHEHNQLIIDQLITRGPVAPAELTALADKFLAHLPYRRVTILDDATAAACAAVLAAEDYAHDTELVMTYAGGAPVFGAPVFGAPVFGAPVFGGPVFGGPVFGGTVPGAPAEEVTTEELRPALIRQLCAWMPQVPGDVIYQLADRRATRLRGADQVRFLAVRDSSGAIASWADLYLDRATGIAQIEDVMTADGRTRRGYADTVLATALHQAAGCDLVFLLADADDWPRTWYARRGFSTVGRSHVFTRSEAIA